MPRALFIFFLFICQTNLFASHFVDSLNREIKQVSSAKKSLKQQKKLIELHILTAWELKNSKSDSALYHCQKSLQLIHTNYGSKTSNFISLLDSRIKNKKNKDHKIPLLMFQTQSVLGVILDIKGNYSKSLEHYFFALKIIQVFENNKVKLKELDIYKSNVLGNIAIIYEELGDLDKALSYNQETLSLYKKHDDKSGEAISLGNIAIIYLNKKDYKNAKAYFEQAIQILREIKDESNLSKNLSNLALVYFEEQNYSKALELFNEGLKIDEKGDDKMGIASKLGNIALIYIRSGKYDLAEKELLKAIELAQNLKSIHLLKDHHQYFSELYELSNREKEALYHYKQAILYADSLKNYDVIRDKTLLEANFNFDKIQYAQKLKQEKKNITHKVERENQKIIITLISLTAVLLLIIGFFIVYNLHKNKKQFELDTAKRRLEIEIKLLRTQMNPHFIFNSLNSVYNYIHQENTSEAGKLLLQFSKLIRIILEHSTREYVSLEEEMEQIKLYASIEQNRFSNSFSFELDIKDTIQADEIEIPTMIIQPFIENAIIHGLGPLKNKKGVLSVSFNLLKQDKLCVTIEDNGVGRTKKTGSDDKKHTSLSIKLIRERLQLMDPSGSESVTICDKEEGVKVELIIPVKFLY